MRELINSTLLGIEWAYKIPNGKDGTSSKKIAKGQWKPN
jgi:hypothetical protein